MVDQINNTVDELDMNDTAPIVSSAVLYNGVIHSMPAPARHHDILHKMGVGSVIDGQGFLDANGNFLDRETAAKVAAFWSQIKGRSLIAAPRLYSEDLW